MDEGNQVNKSEYGKKPLWQWILIYIIIGGIIYAIGYYFVSSRSNGPYKPAESPQVQVPSISRPEQKFTVIGTDFSFNPSTIIVKNNEAVTVTFKNEGKFPHNFVISDLNVTSKTIQPGEEDSVTFMPVTTGSYTYICSVPSHSDRGMVGTITVK
jgi:plastocyanin